MKKMAIIVAAGTGSRMNHHMPKQFMLLQNKPILAWSIEAFAQSFTDIEIVVVAHPDYLDDTKAITNKIDTSIKVVSGGATRFNSVKNGLEEVTTEAIVFVHDAVRCLITPETIKLCYETALQQGNAIPCVAATDSIRIKHTESQNQSVNREQIMLVQTPQTFRASQLKQAFQQPYNTLFTDEANVVEYNGHTIHLVEGSYENIKITRPIDLILANHILENRAKLTI